MYFICLFVFSPYLIGILNPIDHESISAIGKHLFIAATALCGDNVFHSNDSRYFGFVPEDYIIGVAMRR